MKRITFLIGNGFDVNVGLDTRYRDFYEYYKVKCWDDRLAKSIKSNYKYWADLEVGLGKYTVQIKRGQEESFWESEQNLERMLAEYLEGQMGRIQWDGEEKRRAIALKMKESLLEFYSELQDREKAYIRNYISKTSESIGYSFISFNYTDTLKRCLEIANNIINGQINTRGALFKGRRYRDVISEVLYIHGTTSEGMVLGVNDAGQIANRDFRNSSRHLVKKEINKAIAQERISEACKMIDESMIVCIFGMSIGETDKIWWQYLCRWLQFDSCRRLIIYSKKPEGRITAHQIQRNREEMLGRLKKNSEVENTKWEQLVGQIYTGFGGNMFRFELL